MYVEYQKKYTQALPVADATFHVLHKYEADPAPSASKKSQKTPNSGNMHIAQIGNMQKAPSIGPASANIPPDDFPLPLNFYKNIKMHRVSQL